MSQSYHKVKSVGKKITPLGQGLDEVVQRAMKIASDLVGATLGPGGMPVLIERQEFGLPPTVTKDGVTVFRALGFEDSTSQVILEAARDAAVRTAAEAGDGTTTATIIAEAVVRSIGAFTKKHPKTSAQKVVRALENIFASTLEPSIAASAKFTVPTTDTTEEGAEAARQALLYAVAKTSVNGDGELADRVLECYDLVGDDGNVTIVEMNGASSYEVERLEGYGIDVGLEQSCRHFYSKYINDQGNQRCFLERPVFILYHGKITEPSVLTKLMYQIVAMYQNNGIGNNVVVVATGFSDLVLAGFATNMSDARAVKVFPLLCPLSVDPHGPLNLLLDLAALTGGTVLDPLDPQRNLEVATVEVLGGVTEGVTAFEATRFKSTIIGRTVDCEQNVLLRADELRKQIDDPASIVDKRLTEIRLGKLTDGIARLKIYGPSNGETKEKRDRAEDAICAVRGAIRNGALPGGCWMLLRLIGQLQDLVKSPDYGEFRAQVAQEVLIPALMAPADRLLHNVGYNPEEAAPVLKEVAEAAKADIPHIFDAMDGKMVDAFEKGILDSVPAVTEAVRNSLSIAALLGTLGGVVVFRRDSELERSEAMNVADFVRTLEGSGADERP